MTCFFFLRTGCRPKTKPPQRFATFQNNDSDLQFFFFAKCILNNNQYNKYLYEAA